MKTVSQTLAAMARAAERCEHHQTEFCNDCKPAQQHHSEIARLRAALVEIRRLVERDLPGEGSDFHAVLDDALKDQP